MFVYVLETDDSVIGATDVPQGLIAGFWHPYTSESGLMRLWGGIIDKTTAYNLLVHGTSAQVYSDGYEAWQSLAGFKFMLLWEYSLETYAGYNLRSPMGKLALVLEMKETALKNPMKTLVNEVKNMGN